MGYLKLRLTKNEIEHAKHQIDALHPLQGEGLIGLFPNIATLWKKISGSRKPNNSKVQQDGAPIFPAKAATPVSPLSRKLTEQSSSMMKSLMASRLDTYLHTGVTMPADQLQRLKA